MLNSDKTSLILRIVIPLTLILALYISMLFIVFLPKYRNTIISEQKKVLINYNNNAFYILEAFYQKSIKHPSQTDSLKQQALDIIRSLHFGPKSLDYYWLIDISGKVLAHPYLPENISLYNHQDIAGNFPIQQMIKIADNQGEGYLNYYWQWNNVPSRNEKKLSYVKYFKPWEWIIGTGMYMSDANQKIKSYTNRLFLLAALFFAGMAALLLIILQQSRRLINQLHQSRKQLLRNEEQFRHMAENIDRGISIIEDDRVIYMNPKMKTILALDENDDINIKLFDFIVAEDMQRIQTVYSAFSTSGIPVNQLNFRIITKDGHEKHLSNKYIQVQISNQRVINYIITSDVTEQIKSDELLRKLYESVEQSPVSIVITDLNGDIEYVNPWFRKNTGYSFTEVKGENPRILNSGKMPDEIFQTMWKTISAGKIWKGELLNKRKSGELIWESTIIAPILNEDREITHYVAIKEDITEKKQLRDDLVKAKERAEESDRLKTAFLANLSHEIRTPLNAIVGFVSILEKTNDPGMFREFMNQVVNNSNILLKLIEDVLEFSKMEAGKIEISPKPFNLNEVITDLKNLFIERNKQEENKDISFECTTTTHDLYLLTDKARFRQVFINLLSNALKFTQKGTIYFGVEKVLTDKFIFFVKDTGIGIKENELNRIFDRFEHGTSVYISLHKGTGLGLTITKYLVELLGGQIRVESVFQRGSAFYFELPRKEFSPDEIEENNVHLNNEVNWEGINVILQASNEPDFFREIITKTKANLVIASDVQDIIKNHAASSYKLNLIVLDMDLLTHTGLAQVISVLNGSSFVLCFSNDKLIPESIRHNKQVRLIKKPMNPIELISILDSL